MKKVSIIVPAYNVENYIKDTINTLEEQTYKNIEIIIVDDGSTDNTLKISFDLSKKNKNIKVVHQCNKGVSEARNIGLTHVKGDYILFLDSDDQFYADVFEVLERNIHEYSADIIVFGANVISYDPRCVLADIEPRDILYRRFEVSALFDEVGARPYVWNCAYKTEFVKNNKLCFDEEISLGEDQLFQFCAFPKAETIQFLKDKLYRYNFLANGVSNKEYFINTFCRCKLHIKLVEKIIVAFRPYDNCVQMQKALYLWIYDFLHNDFFSLNKSEYKEISFTFKKMLQKHKIDILKLPVPFKKKLCYLTFCSSCLKNIKEFLKHKDDK